MVVRLRVTEIECCLAVAVPFDAWREIGRDGMCERNMDLIFQRRFWLWTISAVEMCGEKYHAKWGLRVNYFHLLCLLKCRGSRWVLAFIGKNQRRSPHKILHLVHICVSNTYKVDKLSESAVEIVEMSLFNITIYFNINIHLMEKIGRIYFSFFNTAIGQKRTNPLFWQSRFNPFLGQI